MPLPLAFILQPTDLWMPILFIAAWLVLSCMKAIANDVDRMNRRHRLQSEARVLREKQADRLRAFGIGTR